MAVLALALVASLAWCQALDQARRAFDRGDYAAAARLFEQAHQASPSCQILFFLGLARYRLKQPDPALIAFRFAVECDPKLLPAHLALGEAYAERHNDSEALAALGGGATQFTVISAMTLTNTRKLLILRSGANGFWLVPAFQNPFSATC